MGGLLFAAGRGLKPATRTVPQLALSPVRHSGVAIGQHAEAPCVPVEGVSMQDLQLTRKRDWGHSVGVQGQIISQTLGWHYHLNYIPT